MLIPESGGKIDNTAGVHFTVIDPELDRGFISNQNTCPDASFQLSPSSGVRWGVNKSPN
jgi:hypothetical protein